MNTQISKKKTCTISFNCEAPACLLSKRCSGNWFNICVVPNLFLDHSSTEDETSGLQFTPLVGILLGAIIALLLIAAAVVLTLRRVRARELRSSRRDAEESREKMLSMHTMDGDCVGDKSPDVVPCTSTLLDRRKGQCTVGQRNHPVSDASQASDKRSLSDSAIGSYDHEHFPRYFCHMIKCRCDKLGP